MNIDVRHNETDSQFEATVDGQLAYTAYELEDENRIVFTHTVVPQELEGRGIAAALVEHALGYAKERGFEVVPQCAYVASYIKRHPR